MEQLDVFDFYKHREKYILQDGVLCVRLKITGKAFPRRLPEEIYEQVRARLEDVGVGYSSASVTVAPGLGSGPMTAPSPAYSAISTSTFVDHERETTYCESPVDSISHTKLGNDKLEADTTTTTEERQQTQTQMHVKDLVVGADKTEKRMFKPELRAQLFHYGFYIKSHSILPDLESALLSAILAARARGGELEVPTVIQDYERHLRGQRIEETDTGRGGEIGRGSVREKAKAKMVHWATPYDQPKPSPPIHNTTKRLTIKIPSLLSTPFRWEGKYTTSTVPAANKRRGKRYSKNDEMSLTLCASAYTEAIEFWGAFKFNDIQGIIKSEAPPPNDFIKGVYFRWKARVIEPEPNHASELALLNARLELGDKENYGYFEFEAGGHVGVVDVRVVSKCDTYNRQYRFERRQGETMYNRGGVASAFPEDPVVRWMAEWEKMSEPLRLEERNKGVAEADAYDSEDSRRHHSDGLHERRLRRSSSRSSSHSMFW